MIFSREPGTSPTIPGSHLASDLSWQKIWSGTFRKKQMSWIQERDRMHWQCVCINMYTYLEPKWLKWLFFCFWKRLLADKLKGKRNLKLRAHIRLAFTTYSRPMLLAIWYLSSAASSASSLGNTTWQKNTATSNQHLLCWKMGLLGIQVVSLHTPPTMKGIPCCRLLVKVASWRVPLGP